MSESGSGIANIHEAGMRARRAKDAEAGELGGREEASSATGAPVRDEPARDQIAPLAYHLWEQRDEMNGSAEDDWLRAEKQLRKTAP